jgi:hypothetical protein
MSSICKPKKESFLSYKVRRKQILYEKAILIYYHENPLGPLGLVYYYKMFWIDPIEPKHSLFFVSNNIYKKSF